MKKDAKHTITVSKRGTTFIVSDSLTGKVLYHITDSPTYEMFNIDSPILSGIGSIMNVPGNYYSFQKYLSSNDDYHALISDWRKVGIAFLEAFSLFKSKK